MMMYDVWCMMWMLMLMVMAMTIRICFQLCFAWLCCFRQKWWKMFAIHRQIVSDVIFFVPPLHFFVPSDSLEKRTVCKNISFTPKHSNSRLIPKRSKVYSTIQAPGITMIQKRSKVVWAASAFSAASRQGRRADRAQTSRLRPRCQRQQPLGRAGRQ